MNVEKRKNSDPRKDMSMLMAIALVVAGVFVGLVMNSDSPAEQTELQLSDVDLSGEWIGTTTQDYGDEERYDYRIIIQQTGSEVSGIGILDMIEDHDIYAEERISGYVSGNELIFREVETMVLENTTMDQWCHTETTLTYQMVNGQETLVGDWEYVLGEEPECEGIDGRVILTRQ